MQLDDLDFCHSCQRLSNRFLDVTTVQNATVQSSFFFTLSSMYGKDFILRFFEDYDATKTATSHSPLKENSIRKLCNNLVS